MAVRGRVTGRYIIERLGLGLFVAWLASVIVFLLVRVLGDPTSALLPDNATKEQARAVRAELGLNRPLIVQYWDWLKGFVTGSLGDSYRTHLPVWSLISSAALNTGKLVLISLVFAIIVGLPLGVVAAKWHGRWPDSFARGLSFVTMSVPSFWLAIMLVLIFSVHLQWLPSSGTGGIENYILPGITVSLGPVVAGVIRLSRSGMLDVLNSEYIKFSRIKGLGEGRTTVVHGVRNVLIPVWTYLGTYVTILISGTVVVETIFLWPGIGYLTYQSVLARDYPVLQAIVVLVAIVTVVVNLIIDLVYVYIDPRITL
jgi:peptide/nickel transport system permease protein